jgi:hypothetical protein
VGTTILHLVQIQLPSPWNRITAILLGIQALSLIVQIAGVAEIASRFVLSLIWWSFVAIGVSMFLYRVRLIRSTRLLKRSRLALLPILIIGAAVATNALVAMAPSTKIDELYCYMLIPSRIVSDGALHFYLEPWAGAIWPHMIYQISAAPAHAIGYPDATNVVSWALSATLLWFAWRIIRANGNTVPWTALCVAGLCVGLYPAVWWLTGGAAAMGDLALAGAIVALCNRDRLLLSVPSPAYAATLSILLLSASTSKVSLLPVCSILLCLGIWPLLKSAPRLARARVCLAVTLPWLIFFCPIAWWTWIHSGSPFGPTLAGVFGSSVYSDDRLRQIPGERELTQIPLTMLRNAAVGYSPLIWFGVIGVFFVPLAKVTRLTLGCLLALQLMLIYWLLPYDARYLGLQYGIFIVFAAYVPQAVQERLSSARTMIAACAVFLLPWFAIQIYYAKQFFLVSTGVEKSAFYQSHIAFYSDYLKLDRLLPKETVLLASPEFQLHISAVYAPRPIFFDPKDLPPKKPVALLNNAGALLDGYEIGDEIYENPRAVIATFRMPGRAPAVGWLKVVRPPEK